MSDIGECEKCSEFIDGRGGLYLNFAVKALAMFLVTSTIGRFFGTMYASMTIAAAVPAGIYLTIGALFAFLEIQKLNASRKLEFHFRHYTENTDAIDVPEFLAEFPVPGQLEEIHKQVLAMANTTEEGHAKKCGYRLLLNLHGDPVVCSTCGDHVVGHFLGDDTVICLGSDCGREFLFQELEDGDES